MATALDGSFGAAFRRWLLAWGSVAVASSIAFEVLVPHRGIAASTRVWAHLHAFGLHLALGLVFAGADAALHGAVRAPRARRAVGLALAGVVGALLVEEDLRGIAEALPGPLLVLSALGGATVGVIAVSAFAAGARGGARPLRRGLLLAIALLVASLHHLVLTSGYEGLHAAAAVLAASLAAGVLGAWPAIGALGTGRRWVGTRRGPLVVAVVALAAAATVVVDPGFDVVLVARRLPGHAVPTLAARARAHLRPAGEELAVDSAWLADRRGLPPVKPSSPRLLPADGIVVLLTVDALREDVVSPPLVERFPAFSWLRANGLAMEEARSPAPHTTPAIAALMMGKYYSQMHWSRGKAKEPKPFHEKSPTITELLAKKGVQSAAYVALGQISEEYGLGRGFTEPAVRLRSAKDITKKIIARIREGAPGGLFVYAHFFEPHAPYDAPGGTDWDRYLAEVAIVDRALGTLLEALDEPELKDRTVLLVSADHGEGFGEHNATHHGMNLYDELSRVPLFAIGPERRASTSSIPVSLIDVGPTVLDLLGAETPATFMGQSLVPLLAGKTDVTFDRPLILESGRQMRALIEGGRYKFIDDARHGTLELYDLEKDPKELENLWTVDEDRGRRMSAFLDAFFHRHELRKKGYELPYFR